MNPSPDRAIREAHATWITAVNAGDLPRLLTLVTDDVVLINPQGDPVDRAGFAKSFAQAVEQLQFRCESELQEVVVVGSVAYTRAKDALTVGPRAGGPSMRLTGYRLTIYRQHPDGRWLLARDAHTLGAGQTPS